ncbi:MAG: DNA primase [Leptospiraceae bacterium]|nr:DNA primase [Leptospiraceae bacterium]
MNSRELKERIRTSLPIETYIGRFVTLKRYNRSYKGLCPFHREKTPSFTVTPDKGIYHCFGCGRGGDLFAFVMEYEGVEFREAMEILARAAGIDISSLQKNEKKDPAYDLLMRTARLYNEFLNGDSAEAYSNYLRSRKIGEEAIQRFQIGASPDQWQFLIDQFPDEMSTLERLSLIRKSEKTGKHFDFFRGRIMFPIRDPSGQVVGFGGRILPGSDNPAKYMNSPESSVFQKSRVLYGLFENMASIRKSRSAVLTEGYLDVVGLSEAGLATAVAPLGTALTENHVQLLKRYADHITLMLDGDGAGREAARKGARMLLGQGFQSTRMFFLPTGMDPFDLSRRYSGNVIQDFLESSLSTDSYLVFYTLFPDLLGQAFQRFADPERPAELTEGIRGLIHDLRFPQPPGLEEKKAAVERFHSLYSEIQDSVIREFYAQEAARILSIEVGGLIAQLRGRSGGRELSTANDGGGMPSNQSGPVLNAGRPFPVQGGMGPGATPGSGGSDQDKGAAQLIKCERSMMKQLLSYPELLSGNLEELRELDFADPDSEIIWRVLEDRFLTGEGWDEDVLIHSNLPSRVVQSFSGMLAAENSAGPEGSLEATFRELLIQHRILEAKKRMSEIRGQMVVADEVEQSYLWERYSTLLKETKNLEFQLRSQTSKKPGKKAQMGEFGPSGDEN